MTNTQVQPWLTMFSKGEVFKGKIISVALACAEWQDKSLWPVCIRETTNTNMVMEPADGDFHALEVTTKGSESEMRAMVGQTISFVIISPGRGDQKPWVKVDRNRLVCPLDETSKIVLATDCFKIASDLICNGKADGFAFKNINQLSQRIAENILILSKNI
jgi:hypothetical protein